MTLPVPKLLKVENQNEDVAIEHAPTETNHEIVPAEVTDGNRNETAAESHNVAANEEFHMVYGHYEMVQQVKHIDLRGSMHSI